jgi:hypothetical protein
VQPDLEPHLTEMIRPAAVIPEAAARAILTGMAVSSVYRDGLWLAEPSRWVRYETPWTQPLAQGRSPRIGTIRVAYGIPTKYEITLYQVTISEAGLAAGMTPQSLADEALAFGSLSLDRCPRTSLSSPPKPFRY